MAAGKPDTSQDSRPKGRSHWVRKLTGAPEGSQWNAIATNNCPRDMFVSKQEYINISSTKSRKIRKALQALASLEFT